MNEMLTDHRVTEAIKEYAKAEQESVQPAPEIVHHPIDEELQTGDSRLLGGAMEIKAPWKRD